MRYLKIIVGVLVIIIGVVFVLQNKDLQRPIGLKFDPLYMFKAQEVEEPKPPVPLVGEEPLPAGQEETAAGAGAEAAPKEAPPAPAPPPAVTDDPSGVPAFILIFLAFFAGILVASLFGIMEKYRLKKVVRQGAARVRDLEEELKKLRNLPLTQPPTQPVLAPPSSLPEPEEEEPFEPPLETNGEPKGETKEEG